MTVNKKLSGVKSEYVLIILLLLTILVFLILNYFNHPPHEDFYYAEQTKRFGFLKAFKSLYKYYGGRYFTYVLISVNPLFFNSFIAYKAVTFLLMLAFFYVLYLFISEITSNSLNTMEKLLMTLSIIFLYLYKMASIEEGFYWMLSAICYHVSFILIMLFLIFYIRLSNGDKLTGKLFYAFLACVAVSMIPGTNELAASLFLILIFFLLLKSFKVKKRIWYLFFFAIIAIIGTYFLLSAPGNFTRLKETDGQLQFYNSLYNSFIFFIEKVTDWLFNTPMLFVTLLFTPVFFKIIKNQKAEAGIFSVNPVISLSLWVLIMFVNIFTMLWSSGVFPYERTENFIYFVFLTGWFYNVIVILLYVHKKFKINIERLPRYVYAISFAIIILYLFRENNITTAYKDLLSGNAYRYSAELENRYDHILHSDSDTVEVSRIDSVPGSFYSRDLIYDSSVWSDQAFANYFNKKAVIVEKSKAIQK